MSRKRPQPSEFGQRLRELREAIAVSQQQLSMSAGLSASAVNQFESGRIAAPSAFVALRLADVLGTTVEYLLLGKGRPPGVSASREALDKESRRWRKN